MENATKALLIAASVLIVIVLISVGIKLLSSTSGVTDQVDSVSETMAVSVFNSQFTSYFGNSVSGTQAKALVQKIISNNSNSSHQVWIGCPSYTYTGHLDTSRRLSEFYSWINDTDRFLIKVNTDCGAFTHGYDNGYIHCIRVLKLS